MSIHRIAALGASLADGPDLGALAAAYVLMTAVLGPIATKFSDRIPIPAALSAQRIVTSNTG